ncbi:CsgG/HfaB family protein [Olleya aquimaris]|uniref:Curli production assembly/transport component CsgG n=1 Tax=Olleya aquimaris TaxID=639310 RepID=A0A327R8M0_9FLAO|nr:CsgG/HfaB family protein [Olleya aquimaris]RAJ13246.1 curli production assembly/transport component CsgG [Olleya aquimaris]
MLNFRPAIAVILFLILTGCGAFFNQPYKQERARIGETTPVTSKLTEFPLPQEPVVAGVYNFKDQTGQYKAVENGSTFSTAVSQGGTTMLIKALEDSKWFTVIERENLGNLLNERNIIRSTRDEYRKNQNPNEPNLPPLLYAGVLLEGGIISYDTNIITGGAGARYLGIGSSTQYRQDRITVYLRAVSTSSGKILKTVYISKTILSQAVSANLFKYVKYQRLLETEIGFTKNEPVQLAMKEAIEKAVEALIIEGIKDKLWLPRLSEESTAQLIEDFDAEKDEAISTELYERFLTERRGDYAITGALGGTLINGDLPDPQPELNTKIGLKRSLNPYLSLDFTYNKYNLENKEILNEGFMSFDLNIEYKVLPYDNFTPYLFAGVGTNASNYFKAVDPKIQAGFGLEYLIHDNLGVYLYGEHNLAFTDELDGVVAGSVDDMFYRFGLGVNYYLSKPPTKFNQRKELEKLKKAELKAQKLENRRLMQEKKRAERQNKKNN